MKLGVGLALGCPGYKLVYFNSSTTGSTTGTVLQFRTADAPGQFETTYQSWSPEQWPQGLFGFH
jgi:hypothetical protein